MNRRFSVIAGAIFHVVLGSGALVAADMMNAQPVPAATPKPGAPAPTAPPAPEDVFQRYGKILSPGNEPSHPLKLSMPFPDVGQVKIPSPEELAMRDKLERLTNMSDDEIRQSLASWPAFSKMSLGDEGQMLVRIQMFKDHRAKAAQDRAHALGLLTLKPDQMAKFESEYWDKRTKMDFDLTRQFTPIYKARENQLEEELFREFSTPGQPVPAPAPPVAQAPKPPVAPTAMADAPKPESANPAAAVPMR